MQLSKSGSAPGVSCVNALQAFGLKPRDLDESEGFHCYRRIHRTSRNAVSSVQGPRCCSLRYRAEDGDSFCEFRGIQGGAGGQRAGEDKCWEYIYWFVSRLTFLFI